MTCVSRHCILFGEVIGHRRNNMSRVCCTSVIQSQQVRRFHALVFCSHAGTRSTRTERWSRGGGDGDDTGAVDGIAPPLAYRSCRPSMYFKKKNTLPFTFFTETQHVMLRSKHTLVSNANVCDISVFRIVPPTHLPEVIVRSLGQYYFFINESTLYTSGLLVNFTTYII